MNGRARPPGGSRARSASPEQAQALAQLGEAVLESRRLDQHIRRLARAPSPEKFWAERHFEARSRSQRAGPRVRSMSPNRRQMGVSDVYDFDRKPLAMPVMARDEMPWLSSDDETKPYGRRAASGAQILDRLPLEGVASDEEVARAMLQKAGGAASYTPYKGVGTSDVAELKQALQLAERELQDRDAAAKQRLARVEQREAQRRGALEERLVGMDGRAEDASALRAWADASELKARAYYQELGEAEMRLLRVETKSEAQTRQLADQRRSAAAAAEERTLLAMQEVRNAEVRMERAEAVANVKLEAAEERSRQLAEEQRGTQRELRSKSGYRDEAAELQRKLDRLNAQLQEVTNAKDKAQQRASTLQNQALREEHRSAELQGRLLGDLTASGDLAAKWARSEAAAADELKQIQNKAANLEDQVSGFERSEAKLQAFANLEQSAAQRHKVLLDRSDARVRELEDRGPKAGGADPAAHARAQELMREVMQLKDALAQQEARERGTRQQLEAEAAMLRRQLDARAVAASSAPMPPPPERVASPQVSARAPALEPVSPPVRRELSPPASNPSSARRAQAGGMLTQDLRLGQASPSSARDRSFSPGQLSPASPTSPSSPTSPTWGDRFSARLDASTGSLGLSINTKVVGPQGALLLISGVEAGSTAAKANLSRGDRIRAVNGKSGAATDLLSALGGAAKARAAVELHLERWEPYLRALDQVEAIRERSRSGSPRSTPRQTPLDTPGGSRPDTGRSRPETPGRTPRPRRWTVRLKKAKGTLGVSLLTAQQKEGQVLLVWRVAPGAPLDTWNKAEPSAAVKPGDRVISADRDVTEVSAIVQCLKSRDAVDLLVERDDRWVAALRVAEREKAEGVRGDQRAQTAAPSNVGEPVERPPRSRTMAPESPGQASSLLSPVVTASAGPTSPVSAPRSPSPGYSVASFGAPVSPTSPSGEKKTWSAEIFKGEQGLGLILRKSARDECIVGELKPNGAVMEWNASNPQHTLQKGDKVLSANGRSGGAAEIIAAVRDSGASVEFVLERGVASDLSASNLGSPSSRFPTSPSNMMSPSNR